MKPFTAYAKSDFELRDKNGGFITYYDIVSEWYRPRRFRSDSNWFRSIRVYIQDSNTYYYGRYCLDTPEVLLTPYADQTAAARKTVHTIYGIQGG